MSGTFLSVGDKAIEKKLTFVNLQSSEEARQ